MAARTDIHKTTRRKRRRQRGVLTALGFVFAASAVLRIGDLDLALADGGAPDAPRATPTAHSAPAGPLSDRASGAAQSSATAQLRAALGEVEDLRRDLERREAALSDREIAVATAQSLVVERLAELESAESRLEELIAISDGAAESDLDRLTTVYETMAPERAAALFEQMQPSFAAGFLSRMTPQSGAALMAELTPEAAYAVSVIIATRNATAPTMISGDPNRPNDTEN